MTGELLIEMGASHFTPGDLSNSARHEDQLNPRDEGRAAGEPPSDGRRGENNRGAHTREA